MSDPYREFASRLRTSLANRGLPLKITSVQDANGDESVFEVHAVCLDDPILRPEPGSGIDCTETGPWTRRNVNVVVWLPETRNSQVAAQLDFATKDIHDAGDRLGSFHWLFNESGEPGLAEMKFSDKQIFKLDYISVLPPAYVRAFVELCVEVHRGNLHSATDS